MIHNIKSTMTDRCVVNQAAIHKINDLWEKNLHILYCHLHPLDTITSEVKKCLSLMEDKTIDRHLSKSGCLIEQILAAFDRLRYCESYSWLCIYIYIYIYYVNYLMSPYEIVDLLIISVTPVGFAFIY